MFLDVYFYQILEGLPYAITERFTRIRADDRHSGIEPRRNEPTTELLFPTDWMSLREESAISLKVRRRHGYVPGMPEDKFAAEQVFAFILDCFGRPFRLFSVRSVTVGRRFFALR